MTGVQQPPQTADKAAKKPPRPNKATRHRCSSCVLRHKKCPGEKPICSSCAEKNMTCQYDETNPGGLSRAGTPSGTTGPSLKTGDTAATGNSGSSERPVRDRRHAANPRLSRPLDAQFVTASVIDLATDEDGDTVMGSGTDVSSRDATPMARQASRSLHNTPGSEHHSISVPTLPIMRKTNNASKKTRRDAPSKKESKRNPEYDAAIKAARAARLEFMKEPAAPELATARRSIEKPDGELEMEAMLESRKNRTLSHNYQAVSFEEIPVSHLSAAEQLRWKKLAKMLHQFMNYTNQMPIDEDEALRKELRQIIILVRKSQIEGEANPEFVLALAKLVDCARMIHDWYDAAQALQLSSQKLKRCIEATEESNNDSGYHD